MDMLDLFSLVFLLDKLMNEKINHIFSVVVLRSCYGKHTTHNPSQPENFFISTYKTSIILVIRIC